MDREQDVRKEGRMEGQISSDFDTAPKCLFEKHNHYKEQLQYLKLSRSDTDYFLNRQTLYFSKRW